MKIYIEFTNGAIIPTGFESISQAVEVVNEVGGFVNINGNVYAKKLITRIITEAQITPFLSNMIENDYDTQGVLHTIIKNRTKEWRKVNSYNHLVSIYDSYKSSNDSLAVGIQPISLKPIYLPKK